MIHQLCNKLILTLILVSGFIGLQAQTLKITDPVKYNDYIVNEQNRIGGELLKLIAMFDALPEEQSETFAQLDSVISTAKSAILNMQNLSDQITKECGLKSQAIALFEFYQRIMDSEYRTVINQLYAETPDMELLQGILVKIQEEESVIDTKFQAAQSKFAEAHNIQLEQNELQDDFDDAAEDE